jgi:hypothetical protein
MEIAIGIAAVERGTVVRLADRRFVPANRRHGSGKPALATRTRRFLRRRRPELYPEIIPPARLADGSIVELDLLSSRVQAEL